MRASPSPTLVAALAIAVLGLVAFADASYGAAKIGTFQLRPPSSPGERRISQ